MKVEQLQNAVKLTSPETGSITILTSVDLDSVEGIDQVTTNEPVVIPVANLAGLYAACLQVFSGASSGAGAGASLPEGSLPALLTTRISVRQDNHESILTATIDQTKEYFIDGVVTITNLLAFFQYDDSGTFKIAGYGGGKSKIICNLSSYTFIENLEGAGLPLGDNLEIEGVEFQITGESSKVYDVHEAEYPTWLLFTVYSQGDRVTDAGLNYEYINGTPSSGNPTSDVTFWLFLPPKKMNLVDVIYTNCVDIGIQEYSSYMGTRIARNGNNPTTEFIGVWERFQERDSVVSLVSGSDPIFKAGAGFLMNNRFSLDSIDIDLGPTAPLFDFAPANFAVSDLLEITESFVERDGVFDSSDTTIFPNITASDLESDWFRNTGLPHTLKGGHLSISVEVETVITVQSQFEDLLGTVVSSELDHVDSPSNGELRSLSRNTVCFSVSGDFPIAGSSGDLIAMRLAIFRDATSTFEFTTSIIRVVNSFQGGRDAVFISPSFIISMNENDIVNIQVANTSGTDNLTAELNSYWHIHKIG